MSFSDPQSVTINAVANSLPRVSSGDGTGTFKKDDGTLELHVAHSYNKRTRRTIGVTSSKVAADPLISAQNIKYTTKVYLVVDEPPTGYTRAELKLIVDGFLAYLTASSGARMTQLLGGEN